MLLLQTLRCTYVITALKFVLSMCTYLGCNITIEFLALIPRFFFSFTDHYEIFVANIRSILDR